MRLFGRRDNKIDRSDRAEWQTPPFDRKIIRLSQHTPTVNARCKLKGPGILSHLRRCVGLGFRIRRMFGIRPWVWRGVRAGRQPTQVCFHTCTSPAVIFATRTSPAVVFRTITCSGVVFATRTCPAVLFKTVTRPGVLFTTKTGC